MTLLARTLWRRRRAQRSTSATVVFSQRIGYKTRKQVVTTSTDEDGLLGCKAQTMSWPSNLLQCKNAISFQSDEPIFLTLERYDSVAALLNLA